jgi:DNA-binding transcriptional MerR regulator
MATDILKASDHNPIYNIKAVAYLVGLLPVTLRAWERRYGLPRPQRGGQGYRLYSEYDVRTLRWLKSQVEAGMSIGRAADYLHDLRTSGRDPAISPPASQHEPGSLAALSGQLYHALVSLDENAAGNVLRLAFGLYTLDWVLPKVIRPALVEIGAEWQRGNLPVASEHFASQFVVQHLMSLLNAAPAPVRPGLIVAACAPGERHQIGLMILVVILRWRGWDVLYLGPDLSLERLEEVLATLRPQVLMFSATRGESVAGLQQLPELLARMPEPKPLVLLGGQAFEQESARVIPAVYLDSEAEDQVKEIERILQTRVTNPIGVKFDG